MESSTSTAFVKNDCKVCCLIALMHMLRTNTISNAFGPCDYSECKCVVDNWTSRSCSAIAAGQKNFYNPASGVSRSHSPKLQRSFTRLFPLVPGKKSARIKHGWKQLCHANSELFLASLWTTHWAIAARHYFEKIDRGLCLRAKIGYYRTDLAYCLDWRKFRVRVNHCHQFNYVVIKSSVDVIEQ